MQPLEYCSNYQPIYKVRDTRRRFIDLEKIGCDPAKYGHKDLIDKLPKGYISKCRQGDFRHSLKKINVAICANRGGKTEVLVIKAIHNLENIKVEIADARYWFVTESFDIQKSTIQAKIKIYFKPERIIESSKSYVKKEVFHSFNYINKWGVRIPVEFKTYEQQREKLQGAKLYGATLDEEPSEEIFDEVFTRTADLDGIIDIGFTPLKGLTWSYKRLLHGDPKDIATFNWGAIDNPFYPRERIELMRRQLSIKSFNMRMLGIYQGAEGMIYDDFSRDENVKQGLFDPDIPVSVSVDWGVVCACIGFFQKKRIIKDTRGIYLLNQDDKVRYEYCLIDAFEIKNAGYGQVMKAIFDRKFDMRYDIPVTEWYCDPAGRARSQATKTGVSLLYKIEKDYGIKFSYIKRLGIEESIELVAGVILNAANERHFYIQEGIKLNSQGDSPEMRIESYVRDDDNHQPIKDGVNDHFCDMLRYYVANKIINDGEISFRQH